MFPLEIVPLSLNSVIAFQFRIAFSIFNTQFIIDRNQIIKQQSVYTFALIFRQNTHQIQINYLRFRLQSLQQMKQEMIRILSEEGLIDERKEHKEFFNDTLRLGKLQLEQVEKFKKLETKILPEGINYLNLQGISLEARQKLDKFRPNSIGQASRISGISPADISVLLIHLEQMKRK